MSRNRYKKDTNKKTQLNTNDTDTAQKFSEIQELHLKFLESWAEKFPTVFGVNVIKSFNYETVQILNNAFLGDLQ